MYDGQIDSQGRHWVRCPECGDSKNPRKAHFCIFPDGAYCFRCGYYRGISLGEMMEIIAKGDVLVDKDEVEPTRFRVRNDRFTILSAYEEEGREGYWAFPARNANGTVLGWHYRNKKEKVCENAGAKGLGFVGDMLSSSPSQPLIVVEGPFDVLSPRHVCVFGMLSKSSMKLLRLQYVWLFPDPDVIDTQAKMDRFENNLLDVADRLGVFVQGYIIGNADPDEATVLRHIRLDVENQVFREVCDGV